MKSSVSRITAIIPVLLLVLSQSSYGQNSIPSEAAEKALLVAAREIMTDAGTCALITLDEENNPLVRVMDPFLPEKDFTVWFGTNPASRKVDNINRNPIVTLYYLDSDASGYVVIHGNARLVDDPAEKEKHWKVEWEAFYPDNPEGYMLIKVSPVWMEVISYSRGITGDPVTWQPQRISFAGKKPVNR